jgi:hypothetical protein
LKVIPAGAVSIRAKSKRQIREDHGGRCHNRPPDLLRF